MVILMFLLAYAVIGAVWTFIGSIGMLSGKWRIEFTNCDEFGNDLGKMNILWNILFWPITLKAVIQILWMYFTRDKEC